MADPTLDELIAATPREIDTEALRFQGLRGDRSRHLDRAELIARLEALPEPPTDHGTLDLMVARGPHGERQLPDEVTLTVEGGMPGDRWASSRYDAKFQLATACTDFARVVANGQPLELHGDNLFLSLDLSTQNLPPGSRVRIGGALLEVTPQPHNGCKKWVQRFGLDAMQLNLDPAWRSRHLRGIYLRVIRSGVVRRGDAAVVESRAAVLASA